jgi:hypothetical protein
MSRSKLKRRFDVAAIGKTTYRLVQVAQTSDVSWAKRPLAQICVPEVASRATGARSKLIVRCANKRKR